MNWPAGHSRIDSDAACRKDTALAALWTRSACAASAGCSAYTIVELLVTIAIIAVLGGLVVSVVVGSRKIAREAQCRNNLRQLAEAIETYRGSYGEGVYLPPWLTWLCQFPQDQPLLEDRKVFICPEDKSMGREGGRPNALLDAATRRQIAQYRNADIDRGNLRGYPDGAWGGTGVDDIPCSYLFEMNSEPCEWVYEGGLGLPWGDEFAWERPPSLDQYMARADLDGNGILSWYEIKMLSIHGWPGYLRGLGGRVPMVRCFWHADEPYLEDRDWILNIRYDFSVYKGHPRWFYDSPE